MTGSLCVGGGRGSCLIAWGLGRRTRDLAALCVHFQSVLLFLAPSLNSPFRDTVCLQVLVFTEYSGVIPFLLDFLSSAFLASYQQLPSVF